MSVNLNEVYVNPDAWTLNASMVFDYLRVYAEPAGDFVMTWMHAPLVMVGSGVYLRLGHLFLITLLIVTIGLIRSRM